MTLNTERSQAGPCKEILQIESECCSVWSTNQEKSRKKKYDGKNGSISQSKNNARHENSWWQQILTPYHWQISMIDVVACLYYFKCCHWQALSHITYLPLFSHLQVKIINRRKRFVWRRKLMLHKNSVDNLWCGISVWKTLFSRHLFGNKQLLIQKQLLLCGTFYLE